MEQSNEQMMALIQRHFPALSEPKLQKEIAEVGVVKSFPAGAVIMNYGSYVKLVPLLLKGTIKVMREDEEDGKELLLYYLKAGETCSMSFSCCLMEKRSDIRTTAEDEVTLIAIPLQYVDAWISKYPSWKNFVMRSYDDRMREMIKTIDLIAFKKMDERLWKYLSQRAAAHQAKVIHSTHQEIADDLNASREAISRLLKQLEKQGVIQLERNKIKLL